MTTQSDLPANLRQDAFAGVADDYVRFRLPYPAAMLAFDPSGRYAKTIVYGYTVAHKTERA